MRMPIDSPPTSWPAPYDAGMDSELIPKPDAAAVETTDVASDAPPADDPLLASLNDAQRAAAAHGRAPLLVVAGAGTGKTTTLAHRVAHLIRDGADPTRMLLLTFTRRAAKSMTDRVGRLLDAHNVSRNRGRVWSGTFHGVAARLLRQYAPAVELNRNFAILDQSDAQDLVGLIRDEMKLVKKDKRFPKKGTCLGVYSRTVNAQRPLAEVIDEFFPWVDEYEADLKKLLAEYVRRKRDSAVVDYDDLLLFWRALMQSAKGDAVRGKFDYVLVDEYQDTNLLQADILRGLRPNGDGLTVVGDDAQSIYSFRAATVRNILDFPEHFPGSVVVPLERNYRSTQPILDLSNAVIARAKERHEKTLWTDRSEGPRPQLIACRDENEQADYLVGQIVERLESGIELERQAVLFRASHHALQLEVALNNANIPFVKFGGLKFAEAAHVKDVCAFLRLAENPRDRISGTRILTLLPGVGPAKAAGLLDLTSESSELAVWKDANVPKAAADHWPLLVALLRTLQTKDDLPVSEQLSIARRFYTPLMKLKYDNPPQRLADLDQLEGLARRYGSRGEFLADLALDPPSASTEVVEPNHEEDLLTLSTVHSAKGLEWDAVYVMHATDGCFPSDRAAGSDAELEEERRLMYVALTRAKTYLEVTFPRTFYRPGGSAPWGLLAQPSRFLQDDVAKLLDSTESETAEDDIEPGVWNNLLGAWE